MSSTDKSFTSRKDAEAFVAGKNPAVANSVPKPPRFYAVASGNDTGIYTDWEDVRQAITGAKGPKYKKFETYAEAVGFIEIYGDELTIARVKRNKAAPTTAASTSTKKNVETPAKVVPQLREDAIDVYTDGSCLGNGKNGATAGVGVYFGENDPRNLAERLEGEVQTNNRGELTALLRAMQIVPLTKDLRIFSDSKYSIECVTSWYKNWEKKGWKTSTGADVLNSDLVLAVRKQVDARAEAGAQTVFVYVKAHADNDGNNAADLLAREGAGMR